MRSAVRKLGFGLSAAVALAIGSFDHGAQAQEAQDGTSGYATRTGTYRLRADAIGQARAPTGVLSVQADVAPTDWVDAEALVWGLSSDFGTEADVLVGRVRLRDVDRRAELSLGRMVVGPGAIRPLHLDGGQLILRAPWGMSLEAFGGAPVTPRFAARDYDWAVGGRLAQRIASVATVGVAYLQRRRSGRLEDHEVGGDLAVRLGARVDLVGRAAWDLQNPGFSEALAALRYRPGEAWLLELSGSHRSPSRILPATSLFSVLGDVASDQLWARARWRAAPRLDVIVDAGARSFEGGLGEQARLRAVLRLDDYGRGVLGAQLERVGGPADVAYAGARVTLQVPVGTLWLVSTEIELVRPDQSEPVAAKLAGRLAPAPSRGEWWPWGLVALELRPTEAWRIAAALEASATSSDEWAVDGLARVAWQWGAP